MGRDSLSYGWLCLNPRKWGLDKCLCVGFTPSKRLTCSQGKDHDFGRPEIVFVGARYACAISVALFLKRENIHQGLKGAKGKGDMCGILCIERNMRREDRKQTWQPGTCKKCPWDSEQHNLQ